MAEYLIKIYEDTDGEWKVDSPQPQPPNQLLRWGDKLTFYLETEKKTTAHIQFAHPRHGLARGRPSECFLEPVNSPEDLDPHWRSKITIAGKNDGVVLQVRDLVVPGEYHYAVFVSIAGKFALGSNPPPKIDVGGG